MTVARINLSDPMVTALYDNWRRFATTGVWSTHYYQTMGWDLKYDAVSRLYSVPRSQLDFFLLTL